ncbi:hypothetical protein [Aquabacterium sp.]|uniref:hypothetical protein n=1 Tax=Aquabacterium sp. TaxID=1872578 RepID=UPI004038483F
MSASRLILCFCLWHNTPGGQAQHEAGKRVAKLTVQFRGDDVSLECLMVLASVDDHESQGLAWAGLPQWIHRPDYLRQLLVQGDIESKRDLMAKYVTLKACEKSGGHTA